MRIMADLYDPESCPNVPIRGQIVLSGFSSLWDFESRVARVGESPTGISLWDSRGPSLMLQDSGPSRNGSRSTSCVPAARCTLGTDIPFPQICYCCSRLFAARANMPCASLTGCPPAARHLGIPRPHVSCSRRRSVSQVGSALGGYG